MERLREVLWSNLQSERCLNEYELVILATSAYVHDIGMQWTYDMASGKYVEVSRPPFDAYDKVRADHAGRSAMIVKASLGLEKIPSPDLGIKTLKPIAELGSYVADCVSHHQGDYEVRPDQDDFSGKVIRIGLLRGLLRIADTLDLDHRRVDMEKLTLYDIPVESKIHWWTHHYVKSVRVENGKIKVSFDFPTTLSPPVARFFARRVRDKISDELTRHYDLFWAEMVFLNLEREAPLVSSFEPGMVKLPLPKEVEDQISRIVGEKERKGELAESFAPLEPSSPRGLDDWISYWGFTGNPWVDLPTSLKREDFVATKSVKKIVSLTKAIGSGKSGQIQLLLGDRGIGKTSLFESFPDFFPYEEYDVAIVSLGDDISVFRTSYELTQFIFSRLYRHMRGKSPERVDVNHLKEAMAEYKTKRLIVCFDNLDRFTSKSDLETIGKFFAESQAALQTIGRKAIVIIAASPEWGTVLKSEHLGYLNFETAWKLKPFDLGEARELISRRIQVAGKTISDVFSEDSIALINTEAAGNPRQILRRCTVLTESAAAKHVSLVDKRFIIAHHSGEVDTNLARVMWNLADRSDKHKTALGSLYYFYETMERESLDPERGWSIFLQLAEGPVGAAIIDPAYLNCLSYVTDRTVTESAETYRKLKKNVNDYIQDWCRSGLTVSDFVSAFRVKPVHPKDFDVKILEQVRTAALPAEVRWYVNGARGYYAEALEESVFPTKVVDRSWRTVEFLIKAYLLREGAIRAEGLRDDRLGEDRFLDGSGRLRRKRPDDLTAEARGLIEIFDEHRKRKGIYIKTYDQVRLLMRKREQFLKAGVRYRAEALELAQENAKICRVALKQVYSEFISLLL